MKNCGLFLSLYIEELLYYNKNDDSVGRNRLFFDDNSNHNK